MTNSASMLDVQCNSTCFCNAYLQVQLDVRLEWLVASALRSYILLRGMRSTRRGSCRNDSSDAVDSTTSSWPNIWPRCEDSAECPASSARARQACVGGATNKLHVREAGHARWHNIVNAQAGRTALCQ